MKVLTAQFIKLMLVEGTLVLHLSIAFCALSAKKSERVSRSASRSSYEVTLVAAFISIDSTSNREDSYRSIGIFLILIGELILNKGILTDKSTRDNASTLVGTPVI